MSKIIEFKTTFERHKVKIAGTVYEAYNRNEISLCAIATGQQLATMLTPIQEGNKVSAKTEKQINSNLKFMLTSLIIGLSDDHKKLIGQAPIVAKMNLFNQLFSDEKSGGKGNE